MAPQALDPRRFSFSGAENSREESLAVSFCEQNTIRSPRMKSGLFFCLAFGGYVVTSSILKSSLHL